ncbi:MAG: hypothetical protein GWO02_16785 [Gammaproteobacteria bacterium]|nr:hypothetical protein [Gammaproteobacteria bacterium]
MRTKSDLTVGDAASVASAELLVAPPLTCDRRIAAAPGHGATVELV